ncbi:MAG TPA: hypothetical protein VHB27_18605 [Rhodopila sp.]|uniref:hypothetical protein n=1 Tax=Rhodopila sp. TaxID=2480087 RepID=UPI002C370F26|nr:hypothetical protein [Rhodopila sp.]HVY17242.1 hypothetical protein [Rhodopila sp.]
MAVKALKVQLVPPLPDAGAQILGHAGPLAGVRALLSARDVEVLCALIRSGCRAVTCLKPGSKADRSDYDLVLISDTGASPDDAIRLAHQALAPTGRIVLGVAAHKALALTRRLRLNGFRTIRTTALPGLAVVQADGPGRAA